MNFGRVHRLLRLITLLQSGRGYLIDELIDELGVSRRTVFRDLNTLELAGVPYYHESATGYRIHRSFFLPPINLTIPETLGLMVLGKTAAAQRDKPLVGPALSAIYKLISLVPEPIRSACGEMMTNVSVAPFAQVPGEAEAKNFTLLQQCVDEGRICRIVYRSPSESGSLSTRLMPYAMHFASRAWYVLGPTDIHREVRIFKVNRFEELELLDEKFAKPNNFSVADKLGQAWQLIPEGKLYNIELLFTAKVATNVSEVRWHASQQHEMLDDGRCRMKFTVDGLGEIAWWLCGYANHVEVVEPLELRSRVRDMLEAALANYS